MNNTIKCIFKRCDGTFYNPINNTLFICSDCDGIISKKSNSRCLCCNYLLYDVLTDVVCIHCCIVYIYDIPFVVYSSLILKTNINNNFKYIVLHHDD